jgi:hypothetical protein
VPAVLLLVALLSIPTGVVAQEGPRSPAIGSVRFPVSCGAAAQPAFDRAVTLLHSFAFAQAAAGFDEVLRAEPRCAMAYWGLALTAWGNPFAAGIKSPDQVRRGLAAVTRGREAVPPTGRERGYLDAVAGLYEGADSIDQPTRLKRYRSRMAELATAEPADTEATIFHVLSILISADPADQTHADLVAGGATLEHLFARMPNHPGLAHYLIHAYDVPPLASRALGAAGRYARIAPTASHALHMPSHTYTRLGDWDRSIATNVKAGTAARREGGVAEELHAADYRVYAYLQRGQLRRARRLASDVVEIGRRLDPNAVGTGAPPAAGYFALAAIPARYALERGAWAEAAALQLRPSPVPFADAMTHYARALGGARSGDAAVAREAVAALGAIRGRLVERRESYWAEQVEIQRRAGTAWLLLAEGKPDSALAEMAAAAEREDATEKNAITPGPLAPARELQGEMLLELHRPAAALAAFEATLVREPNRWRALSGAARAAREAGDRARAREHEKALRRLRAGADPSGAAAEVR